VSRGTAQEEIMLTSSTRYWIAASWVTLALLAFLAVGARSGMSWALFAIVGIMPAVVMLAVWKDAPPSISEVISGVERKP
jgi:hypothetical protein